MQFTISYVYIMAYFRIYKLFKIFYYSDLKSCGFSLNFNDFFIFDITQNTYSINELIYIFETYQIMLLVAFIKLIAIPCYFTIKEIFNSGKT